MGTTAGYDEGFGQIRTGLAEFNGKIVVGLKDFVIMGHKSDISTWLTENGSINVSVPEDYGWTDRYGVRRHSVFMILRSKQATVGEELAKAYGGALGAGGITSTVGLGVSSLLETSVTASLVVEAVTTFGDPVADEALDAVAGGSSKLAKLADKIFGSSFTLRLSAAKGTYSDTGVAKGSVNAGFDPACPGDANGDGQTDVLDLIAVLIDFGTVCDPDPVPCDSDLNNSGAVDVLDLIVVVLDLGCGLTPCESNADCDDGLQCTRDICVAGHCLNLAIPNCFEFP